MTEKGLKDYMSKQNRQRIIKDNPWIKSSKNIQRIFSKNTFFHTAVFC